MQQVSQNLFPFPDPGHSDFRPENAPLTKRQKYVAEHFPDVIYGSKPLGNHVYVQLRLVPAKTKGGIALPGQTRDFNEQQTCLAIVREVGVGAFKDRDSGKAWHEGPWYKVGDLVMVKRHEGRRFAIGVSGSEDRVIFADVDEYHVTAKVDDAFDDLENLYDQII